MKGFRSVNILLALVLLALFWGSRDVQAQPCALFIPSGSTTLSNGSFTYCTVIVSAGATLFIGGAVTLDVNGNVDIEGVVSGTGSGYGSTYALSTGPGMGGNGSVTVEFGVPFYYGGGGGGHGGTGGGFPSGGGMGGVTYDLPGNPVSMGSAGGSGAASIGLGGAGGAGGAALVISAPSGDVTVNGTIDMSGGVGMTDLASSSGGGGSGGALSINAYGIYGTGALSVAGGAGGFGQTGGGGGGDLFLCASNGYEGFTGSQKVSGGIGGNEGTLCTNCVGPGCGCFTYYGPSGQAGNVTDCNPTNTPTITPTPNATTTPSFIFILTTSTFTPSPTNTPTLSPTSTVSPTATASMTATPSLTATATPSPTITVTPTLTPTSSPAPPPCPPGYTGPQPPGQGECFTYPAPATGGLLHFVYDLQQAGRAQIRVWNEKAELVAELTQGQGCGAQETELDLNRFAAGIYFYQVSLSYGSGQVERLKVNKFLVQR